MRARAEPRHARARELPRRWLEMPCLDSLDRRDDDGAAALEVFFGQRLLAIFLETRGPADAEDVLPHAAPDPVLRVPERKESRLKAERVALLVDAVLAGEVVEGQ